MFNNEHAGSGVLFYSLYLQIMSKDLFSIQGSELAQMVDGAITASYEDKTLPKSTAGEKVGMVWSRLFGQGDPYAEIKWVKAEAKITKGDGSVVFQQDNIEVPDFWSQTAVDIVASKYFRGKLGSAGREYSAREMIDRVADTIAQWGWKDGYFSTEQDCENFKNDLKFLLINQFGAFNSPVWFNVGIYERPQCSACFILSVEDTMESILEWYKNEGWIFKFGSGSGINLSKLRSSKETLSRGGHPGGPVSFMKGADGVANSIRSGGTTRRAAKMVVLNTEHPDIKDFIYCKKNIEEMTKILEASGVKNSIEGELFDPYTLLPYQNANNSVRATDEFMRSVENDNDWQLKSVKDGSVMETLKARQIMQWISDAAWHSADPGMQFDTTINDWHTCPNSGRITSSNPCSEYMHIDDSACNLASINLLKFYSEEQGFNTEEFEKAVDVFITAQEILVGNSSYPTQKISKNAVDFRQLGLGYANLGALLMDMGLPYDSEEGRTISAAITSVMTGRAYTRSAAIASIKGPFAGFRINREPMLRVIKKHELAAQGLVAEANSLFHLNENGNGTGNGNGHAASGNANLAGYHYANHWRKHLINESANVWHQALALGKEFGFRNAQATVLAPTGTISFLMDCTTTGIEPDLSLIKYKKLVGGGTLKIVNTQIGPALKTLGYDGQEISDICDFVLAKETVEGAPHIKAEHLAIFDCSFKPANGTRSINYLGHIRMMSAVQPFISGAISKTVNLPQDAKVEDIYDVFMQSWKLGLKAVAVYRDGSKTVQPLTTAAEKKTAQGGLDVSKGYARRKLPNERPSITHKFTIANHEGYLHVGMYPDTKDVGETFITIAKEGSTVSGLLDVIATLVSMCLQSGIPLKVLVNKFKDMRFEPSGITNNPEIPFAKSIVDYIFRYMGGRFLGAQDQEEIFGSASAHVQMSLPVNGNGHDESIAQAMGNGNDNQPSLAIANNQDSSAKNDWDFSSAATLTDAPVCHCGTIMVRAGSCYTCPNCFATTGVCN